MLWLNYYYTNVLINLILTHFNHHRCLLVFSDSDVDFRINTTIPVVAIRADAPIDYNVVFRYYGCQGVVIYSDNAKSIFVEFERQIRLNMERFNERRFLIVSQNDVDFFELKELEYVSDLLLVVTLLVGNDYVFDLKTHKYVGEANNNEVVLIDRWFSKNLSFEFGGSLYPDKLRNQMGRPLRMATFTYEPYSVVGNTDMLKDHQGSELKTGVEFGLMLNMTPVPVVNPKDYWGELYDNWTGIGLLGNLVEDDADIGFAALYTWEICYHFLELSKPLVRTGITCLVPAPKLAARWLTPLYSYTPQLWFCAVILFVVTIFILSFIMGCYNYMSSSRHSHYSRFINASIKLVLKPVLLQSIPLSEIPWELASKLVLALMLLFSLFLTSTYSSGLASVMTLPKYDHAINTVRDFVGSDLQWGATQDGWIISIRDIDDPVYKRIVSKFRPTPEEELKELAEMGTWAFSIERLPFENFAIGDYIGEDVIGNYHLMEEDLYWEQCVMMLRKNSVLLPSLDMFILKVFEAGLISKWQSTAVEMYMNAEVQRVVKYYKHHQQEKNVVKLKWSHVQGAFAVLAFGYGISLVVFVVELVKWK